MKCANLKVMVSLIALIVKMFLVYLNKYLMFVGL